MAQKSDIEWTDATWNPVTGCTKVGPGCDNCYAERFAERRRGICGPPYPVSADEEGDPVTLAEARSLTFAHRRKVLLVSTPTIRGLSRIEREYEASDQRRFFVPCPHCGAMQWLKFDRLRW
ncbi:Bacteriophage tail assembly protein [Sagittula stellata E-37]|uniref:Bacteriophage tail assembly protein n=1 Tax=Sagittula stellata (strain ATCC 700073 / DSM 11524 / E-37) TaxID=388399 RepID=A3JXM4_SAGS3|nr:Bacteriophage tail assembly protein [Sagittula stellata E-37]